MNATKELAKAAKQLYEDIKEIERMELGAIEKDVATLYKLECFIDKCHKIINEEKNDD